LHKFAAKDPKGNLTQKLIEITIYQSEKNNSTIKTVSHGIVGFC
jgi:hypothetical protein